MNRNGQLIAKSEGYAVQLQELLQIMATHLDDPRVLKAFMKADVSGHLYEIRAVSGTEALKKYLLRKAQEDPFAFGESLQLMKFQMKKGMAGGNNSASYRDATSRGVTRVNPNVKAAELGRNLPMEERPANETPAEKSERVKAKRVLEKSICARHCQKVGRANCAYCNGIGYHQRVRQGEWEGQNEY